MIKIALAYGWLDSRLTKKIINAILTGIKYKESSINTWSEH